VWMGSACGCVAWGDGRRFDPSNIHPLLALSTTLYLELTTTFRPYDYPHGAAVGGRGQLRRRWR